MSDNIISYLEMCRREGASLQQGMNFSIEANHSVTLMSVRRNAPYQDRLEDGGTTLIYEGHDQPRGSKFPNSKVVDQPERLPSGRLTQNGKFHEAAQLYRAGKRDPERVRVYEKIRTGIWSYNGVFTSSILGANPISTVKYLSFDLSLLRAMKTLTYRLGGTLSVGA